MMLFLTKLIGYFLVGGLSAIIDTSFFYMAKYHWHFSYIKALVIGFIPGLSINFILCHSLLFVKVKRTLFGAWVRHLLSSLMSFLFNLSVMMILIEGLSFKHYLAARVIAIICGFFMSFLLIRYFAFKDNLQGNTPFMQKVKGRR